MLLLIGLIALVFGWSGFAKLLLGMDAIICTGFALTVGYQTIMHSCAPPVGFLVFACIEVLLDCMLCVKAGEC